MMCGSVTKKQARALKTLANAALAEPSENLAAPSGAGKLIPAAIIAAGILAYVNSLKAPFLFDDRYLIVENEHIRRLWPIWQSLVHTSRPTIQLSLALNYAVGGLNPWGYHAFNIAIHICAALVLYGVVRRTLLSSPLRQRWGAVAPWLAGMIAAIWVVHPLQTESVTYTAQRGESLMGLFYLLTLYCVIRLDASPRGMAWKIAAVASCLMGMACKGVMATAPVTVLLYDRSYLSSSWGEVMRRRKGLYAALAATWLAYPLLLAQATVEWKGSAGFGQTGVSPLVYGMTQPSVILHYLWLTLWPDPLCLDYGWPVVKGIGEALAPGIAIAGLLAAVVWAWRRKPAWGFPGVWFFLILVPTSSFIPIADVAFEHRMYLSLAAVVALGVAAMVLAGQPRSSKGSLRIPRYAWVACGAIVLVMGALTVRRNADYSSPLAMWEATVRASPGSPRGQYDLGTSLEHEGQNEAAIAHYQAAIQLSPNYSDALANLGHLLAMAGKPGEAMVYLRRALAIKPDIAEAHCSLGYALEQQGSKREAISEFEQAIRIKPDYAEAHNNLAIGLAEEGRTQDAIEHWQQALRLDPELSDAHSNLAYALSLAGQTREAISHYDQALRIKPDNTQAQINFAKLLTTAPPADGGNPSRAVALAEEACRLTGNRDPSYLDTLAVSYAAANRFSDAAGTAQTAFQLAGSTGQTELAKQIEVRLQSYRDRRR